MEDSLTVNEHTQRTSEEYLTSLCNTPACRSHTSEHCSMNQLDLTTRSVACLSPSLSTLTHFTHSPACAPVIPPAHPHRPQEVMTCHDTGRQHECSKLFIQSVLDSSQSYVFLTRCLIAEGGAGVDAMWRMHDVKKSRPAAQ